MDLLRSLTSYRCHFFVQTPSCETLLHRDLLLLHHHYYPAGPLYHHGKYEVDLPSVHALCYLLPTRQTLQRTCGVTQNSQATMFGMKTTSEHLHLFTIYIQVQAYTCLCVCLCALGIITHNHTNSESPVPHIVLS